MRTLANRYLTEIEKPARSLPDDIKNLRRNIRANYKTIVLGFISSGLYTLLYFYSVDLTHIAQDTNHGHKVLFFVPILIALIFSFVHGTFTSLFWELIGVKAKQI